MQPPNARVTDEGCGPIQHPKHTGGQVFLYSMAFIKRRLKIQKVNNTACASNKGKTFHQNRKVFCATH